MFEWMSYMQLEEWSPPTFCHTLYWRHDGLVASFISVVSKAFYSLPACHEVIYEWRMTLALSTATSIEAVVYCSVWMAWVCSVWQVGFDLLFDIKYNMYRSALVRGCRALPVVSFEECSPGTIYQSRDFGIPRLQSPVSVLLLSWLMPHHFWCIVSHRQLATFHLALFLLQPPSSFSCVWRLLSRVFSRCFSVDLFLSDVHCSTFLLSSFFSECSSKRILHVSGQSATKASTGMLAAMKYAVLIVLILLLLIVDCYFCQCFAGFPHIMESLWKVKRTFTSVEHHRLYHFHRHHHWDQALIRVTY